ncbi:MAG: prepilin-type N-terminal cleavage/methylation domain-containing protein [Lachnospiraceae bacterium]|nr:prepilin-type N-terminal cleavage/methylation domain-containing protein [Lachnospiraceae bacterium]
MRRPSGNKERFSLARVLKKIRDRAGMTLIELIVGLAISSVVSLMAAQFFSIAVRLHRTSTEISALQKESQTCLTQLTRAVMSTEELYYSDNGRAAVLVLGRELDDGAGFEGQIFYYDRQGKRLYADTDYRNRVTREALFSSLRVQTEIGRLENPEYLVSNKVEDFALSLSRDIADMKSLGNHAYGNPGELCVTAVMTMQYHESRSYEYSANAMPRERIEEIFWNVNR